MKDLRNSGKREFFMNGIKIAVLVLLVTGVNLVSFSARADDREDACSETSKYAKTACYNAAKEVYNLTLGKCENLPEDQQNDCETNAREERDASNKICNDQFAARQQVCVALGGGPYNPDTNPANFVKYRDQIIGNTYYPLKPATYTYFTYESVGKNAAKIEQDVVKITRSTREIQGVTCVVVSDIVTALPKNEVTENTTDWYAQDNEGNVWYFGEIAQQFEDGILVAIDGSWTTGVDMAQPGIIMYAHPENYVAKGGKPGKTYRTEFLLGEAEDIVQIVDVTSTVKLRNGKTYTNCLHTLDYSPLDPGGIASAENKYYAKGVGLVKVEAIDGTVEELDSIK